MRNKNTVIALLIVFVGICAYNLFYTYRQFDLNAERSEKLKAFQVASAIPDSLRTEGDSLDIVAHEKLERDGDFQSSYQTAAERSFTLGLDLQGGMFVTLEIGVEELLKKLAGNSKDADFNAAIECATERSAEEALAY
ncbi:MAG: hypothetical protein AAFQ68_26760, partial [Bacteroidota bacterium]